MTRPKERLRRAGPARIFGRIGAAVAGAALLASCQTSQYPEIQQTGSLRAFRTTDRHPIVVEPGEMQLAVDVPGFSRGLTPRQANEVRAFLDEYKTLGEGEIKVSVASGAANEAAAMAALTDLRNLMGSARVPKTSIRYVAGHGAPGSEPPIVLAFERYFANPSECGHWPRNIAHEPYNKPYANFGCATQNNLAAIVADPRDLVRQRPMTAGDSERRIQVLDGYRRGEATSAERSQAESGQVSEVQ